MLNQVHPTSIDFGRDAVFACWTTKCASLAQATLRAAMDLQSWAFRCFRPIAARAWAARSSRARAHARNWGAPTLFTHCLAENGAMMHLACKQGMRIATERGEADAYLELPPGDAASIAKAIFSDRVALFDYALNRRSTRPGESLQHGRD